MLWGSHTLMLFCSICHHFFSFIPVSVHVLWMLSDDDAVFLAIPALSYSPQFLLDSHLVRYSGVFLVLVLSSFSPPALCFFSIVSSNVFKSCFRN